MQRKFPVQDLAIGMFVEDLDRPWIDTPFLIQGFLIEDDEQLAQLRQHCQWVIVNVMRSTGDAVAQPPTAGVPASKQTPSPASAGAANVLIRRVATPLASTPAEVQRRNGDPARTTDESPIANPERELFIVARVFCPMSSGPIVPDSESSIEMMLVAFASSSPSIVRFSLAAIL